MSLVREHAKQTLVISPLSEAATAGDLDTLTNLLNGDASQNIYCINANEEALLVDVLRAGKTQVAQHLFGIYESDLAAVKQFFASHRNDDDDESPPLWRNTPILVACGAALCDTIAGLVTDSMRLPRVGCEKRPGLVVLLKRDNHSAQSHEVIWLSASSKLPTDNDRAIARIVELIYTETGGGVLHLNANLLDLTALHGMLEFFFRMQPHFGDRLAWDDYMPMLCRLASCCVSHTDSSIVVRDALVDRLARFQLNDLYALENAWKLLEVPMELQNLQMFEYNLTEIVRIRKCRPWDVLHDLFSKSNLLSYEYMYYSKNHQIDYGPFIRKWIAYDGDLWLPHSSRRDWSPLVDICVHHKQANITDDLLSDIIVKHNDRLDHTKRIAFADSLFFHTRFAVLHRWFSTCRDMPTLLHSAGRLNVHLDNTIGGIDGGMELAELLFDSCCATLWEQGTLMSLLLKCASRRRAIGMLRKLLALSQCPDVAADWDEWGDSRSPLFTALMSRCPQNYQVLFDSVRDKAAICSMDEYNGDSILAAAIWSPFDSRETFKFIGDCVEVDDDGFPLPPEDRTRPAEECAIERTQFETFFNTLVEIGCDIHQVNHDNQTLLHHAVIQDNAPIVRALLDAGLDPSICDYTGALPMHLVRSVEVFEMLLEVTDQPEVLMQQRNAKGDTPLGCVANYACTDSLSWAASRHAQTMGLLNAMRAAVPSSADLASALTNSRNGSTPLHGWNLSVTMVNWLLSQRVDINAVNTDNGKTALHEMLIMQSEKMDVIELMLASPNLCWHVVAPRKLSYLSFFVKLTEQQFVDLLPIIESRQSDVDHLFAEQCNSNDAHGIPLLHTAIRSDTNAYCLRRLLEHTDRLCLDGVVRAGIRDAGALRVALELCSARPSALEANLSADTLTHALGHSAFDSMWPCAESVRALIGAGIRVGDISSGPALRGDPVPTVLRHLANGDRVKRKAVVTIAASLIAAGATYEVEAGGKNPLRETILRCLLKD